MAYKANDGSLHTNRMTMNSRNSSLAAKKMDLKDMASPKSPVQDMSMDNDMDQDQDQQKNILDDSEAMECVDKLKQMGYTAEDVETAMNSLDEGSDMSGQDNGQMASKTADLQIPA